MQPIKFRDLDKIHMVGRGPFPLPIDAICEIWQQSASWLQRRFRLKMLTTDGRQRRMVNDACLYYKLTYEPSVQEN